jgi:Domain of unknown function DUF11
MVKKADPAAVKVGDPFTWLLTVSNPNDCPLTKLKIVDTVAATTGVKYEIVSTTPKADAIAEPGSKITFADVGPVPPGQSKDLLIRMKVSDKSSAGKFHNDAVATGRCGPAPAEGGTDVSTGVDDLTPIYDGHAILDQPTVGELTAAGVPEPTRGLPAPAGPERVLGSTLEGQQLPRTGGTAGLFWPVAVLATGTILRLLGRRRARSRSVTN